jgi:hypothetical protein
MQTITTYNGITLGFDEISRNSNSEGLAHHLKVKGLDKHKIIGTTSTLTDEQVMDFIEWSEGREDTMCFKDTKERHFTFIFPLESWNSFLKHNGVDLTKEWVVLLLKK